MRGILSVAFAAALPVRQVCPHGHVPCEVAGPIGKKQKTLLPIVSSRLKGSAKSSNCSSGPPFEVNIRRKKGYSSVGRAAVSKTAGRRFEPCCPCHFPLFDWRVVSQRLWLRVMPDCRQILESAVLPLVKLGIGVYVGFNRHAVRGADNFSFTRRNCVGSQWHPKRIH